ncbi:MAG TPA: S1 RNA-binding domain-containing protein [Polyangiales bacterium]|nr:S1 RNA-binding domain-containing protein [Polyangiales bacterium]
MIGRVELSARLAEAPGNLLENAALLLLRPNFTQDQTMSTDDFASLFEAHDGKAAGKIRPLKLGERVRAEVIQVGRDGVFVEVIDRAGAGKRPEAYFQSIDLRGVDGQLTVKPGDVLEGMVVDVDSSGSVRLGHSLGRDGGVDALEQARAAGVPIEGKVTGVNKGGLEVEVSGARAFCPMSQIERGFVADPQALIGRSLSFLVTEVRDNGKRIVVSRRALLEQEAKHQAAQTLADLKVGAVVRGNVTAVRDFGAFVDLGGIEGLIPNSELSHESGRKATDVLAPGDLVEVSVRDVKPGAPNKRGEATTKITLSLKALSLDPWTEVEKYAPAGKVVRGTVTRLADFGAFVQLTPGIEGLLHISELGGKHAHPSAVLKVGEQINVVVRSVDAAARKISLAPAAEGLAIGADARGPTLVVGSVVNGTVDRVEPYGLFLQVDGTRGRVGRGLIPNAELGVARGADTRKLFPVGTPLTVKVLETGEGKLRLSVKAVKEDEERAEFDGYRASVSKSTLGTLGDLLRKR